MYLASLHLENFRNYCSLNLSFDVDKPCIVIQGANAQGKSNFIESICLLSCVKSFREPNSSNMINFKQTYCRVKGDIQNNNGRKEVEYFYQREPAPIRQMKINEQISTAKQFWGQVKIVLFCPEKLERFFMEPKERRQYLDFVVAQINPEYIMTISEYQKILSQRNSLLKQIAQMRAQKSELNFWNYKLAELGEQIIKRRLTIINEFNQMLNQCYAEITQQNDDLVITYQIAGTGCDLYSHDLSLNFFPLQGYFTDEFNRLADKEITLGTTLIGPHRDDLKIYLNKKPISQFGSRGEKKSLFLSLKKAELSIIEKETNDQPIVLIDDFYSELDQKRRQGITAIIKNHQAIITTVNKEHIPSALRGEIYTVKNCEISKNML